MIPKHNNTIIINIKASIIVDTEFEIRYEDLAEHCLIALTFNVDGLIYAINSINFAIYNVP
jgi:hypothetical protein